MFVQFARLSLSERARARCGNVLFVFNTLVIGLLVLGTIHTEEKTNDSLNYVDS